MSGLVGPLDPAALVQLREHVEADRGLVLGHLQKAVPTTFSALTTSQVIAAKLHPDAFGTPLMLLDRRAMADNVRAMSGWCQEHGLELAPHGKTTMAPALWLAQLEAGSWGITVANEHQLRVALHAGVPRVLVANLLLRPDALGWLVAELQRQPDRQVVCWVDSVEAAEVMEATLTVIGPSRPLDVCVEVGAPGGRTGVRSVEDAVAVAGAIVASRSLRLVGVSGYEGTVAHGTSAADLLAVDTYLHRMVQVHEAVLSLYEAPASLVSAGGSAYFDRVRSVLGPLADPHGERGRPTAVLLRSGAYIVHDDGFYDRVTPAHRWAGPVLRTGMHLWSRVLSRPEPALAIIDAGRRDCPFDEGLPRVQAVRRRLPDGTLSPEVRSLSGHELVDLNDQHAFVVAEPRVDLMVGDLVRLGLSHPCTAFDKWAIVPVVDDTEADTPRVVDLVRTHF